MLKHDLILCSHHWCYISTTGASASTRKQWMPQRPSSSKTLSTSHSYLDLSATGGQILQKSK